MKKRLIRIIDFLLRIIRREKKQFIETPEFRDNVEQLKAEVLKKKEPYNHKKGRLVWNSKRYGTYVRSKYGELK